MINNVYCYKNKKKRSVARTHSQTQIYAGQTRVRANIDFRKQIDESKEKWKRKKTTRTTTTTNSRTNGLTNERRNKWFGKIRTNTPMPAHHHNTNVLFLCFARKNLIYATGFTIIFYYCWRCRILAIFVILVVWKWRVKQGKRHHQFINKHMVWVRRYFLLHVPHLICLDV